MLTKIKNKIFWIAIGLKASVINVISALNRGLGNYDNKIFIIADGRSGTNWLIQILNFDKRYRLIYEPFHGQEFRPHLKDYEEYPYPEKIGNECLKEQILKVWRGDFVTNNVTIEFPRLLYKGLLIKDIGAHLMLDAFSEYFPGTKKIYILRHPFAVAESKCNYKEYGWPTKPSYFLNADKRITTILSNQMDILRRVESLNNQTLKFIVVWCALHRVAFHTKSIIDYNIIFFEDLAADPTMHTEILYSKLGFKDLFNDKKEQITKNFRKPSRVTQKTNTIEESQKGTAAWKSMMDPADIAIGFEILEAFELDHIYGDDHFPKISAEELTKELSIRHSTKSPAPE